MQETLNAIQDDLPKTKYTHPDSIAKASICAAAQMDKTLREPLETVFEYRYTKPSGNSPCPTFEVKEPVNTITATIESDSFEAAKLIKDIGLGKPAVLNMANEYNCGGGFTSSWGSQEECLFRRSTLAFNLWPHRRTDDERFPELDKILPRQNTLYPLSECGGLYSPNVAVIRNVHMVPYRSSQYKKEERYMVSCLSVAAQDLRYWMFHVKVKTFDAELTTGKIRTLLWMAAHHGHKVVILGALGCGAFQNDPAQVSNIFKDLLDGEFKGVFNLVLFAIVKSEHNLSSFSQRFKRMTADEVLNLKFE